MCKAVLDCRLRHRLQPQAFNGLPISAVLHDVTEYQFTFSPRVTGVDHAGDILALQQLGQQLQAVFGAFDGLQVEIRRNNGQIGE